MSVRVKLKNLTTNIIQMGFNHVVPLIQVPGDTQKSKNRLKVRYMYHIGQQKFVINLKWPSNFLHGLKWPLKIWHFRLISCMSNNSILLEFWRLLRVLLTFCRAMPQFYPNPQKRKGIIFTKLEILSSTKITGTWNFLCDSRTCLGRFHD